MLLSRNLQPKKTSRACTGAQATISRRVVKGARELMREKDRVRVDGVPVGTRISIQTKNREYLLETHGGLKAFLTGHPDHCPQPVAVYVSGARRPGSFPDRGLIRTGVAVEFRDPARGIITTSRVRTMRIVSPRANCGLLTDRGRNDVQALRHILRQVANLPKTLRRHNA